MKETFEHKYNLYDIVYINCIKKPDINIHKGKILAFLYYKERCDDESDSEPQLFSSITYYLKLEDGGYAECSEEEVFSTKKELLKALKDE